jgi:hypothetical protein
MSTIVARIIVALETLILILFAGGVSAASSHAVVGPIVVRQLTSQSRLQVKNLRLDSAPPEASQPSAILKFDVFNDASVPLADVVMRISFLKKRLPGASETPDRVVVGPVTIRLGQTLQAGFAVSYQMLFRNLSSDCGCSPRVEILSARVLVD